MSARVNLYDSAYANYGSEIYRRVRMETYGEDFGQTSRVTTEESREIPPPLDLKPNSSALEVGCGSGGYALPPSTSQSLRVGHVPHGPSLDIVQYPAEPLSVEPMLEVQVFEKMKPSGREKRRQLLPNFGNLANCLGLSGDPGS